MNIIVIGGGAAGFFSALAAKKANPEAKVTILERTAKLLSKVRISGGGRCNVTHNCFDPKTLVKNYPRGHKELLGPFHRFQPRDTIEWFESRGVPIKKEKDGRMFPTSNSSESIINCLLMEAEKLGVAIHTQTKLEAIKKTENEFILTTNNGTEMSADCVIMATGSASAGWKFVTSLGHTTQPPVPSLFTFNIPSFTLNNLSGVSIDQATLKLKGTKFEHSGPLLITHWGFSGPAALKLSALAARYLADEKYETCLVIDWIPEFSDEQLRQLIEQYRKNHGTKQVKSLRIIPIPTSLWKSLLERSEISNETLVNNLSKSSISKLLDVLKRDRYEVSGKTTNKEEFVTCGGVKLSEVDFKTMESKCCKGLYFCGEILDIDGVTGGFNFQNAWTTGWIAGQAASST